MESSIVLHSPKSYFLPMAVGVGLCVALLTGCGGRPGTGGGTSATGLGDVAAPGLPLTSPPNALGPKAAIELVSAERDAYWLNAKNEVYKSVPELIGQDQAELERGLAFGKIMRGDPSTKELALTFDDGPHPKYTPKLLAILKRYNVKATFFVVGERAEKNPDLVKAELAAGHNVGNHTYDHVSLTKIPEQYVATEIKACGDVIKKISGRAPHLFRPPGGDYDVNVAETAEALGYRIVLWTDDPGDYASPGADVILQRTLEKAGNGGILLLHDGIEQTIEVLPLILDTLQKQGYRFVTVDELAGGAPARDHLKS